MSYPLIFLPNAQRSLISHIGHSKCCKRSAMEIVPVAAVAAAGLSRCIHDDISVNIDGHKYEPDLAYIDRSRGIHIDIEIDEPYSTTGVPTHYIGRDAERNRNFQDAGWYVIRFTEQQFFCEPQACLKQVCLLAQSAGANLRMPRKLQKQPDVAPDRQWTADESKQLYRYRYRNSYLKMPPSGFHWRYVGRYLQVGLPILWQGLFHHHIRREIADSLYHAVRGRR